MPKKKTEMRKMFLVAMCQDGIDEIEYLGEFDATDDASSLAEEEVEKRRDEGDNSTVVENGSIMSLENLVRMRDTLNEAIKEAK